MAIETYGENFEAAATYLSGQQQLNIAKGSPGAKLLNQLCVLAAADRNRTFRLQAIENVFETVLLDIQQRGTKIEEARLWCRGQMNTQENRMKADNLRKKLNSVMPIPGAKVITRGTGPLQAKAIMENKTFGGDPPAVPPRTDKPTVEAANMQTGLGVKGPESNRLEEWSLGELTGFSTGGFHLIASAPVALMTQPTSAGEFIGERGVCGFANASLLSVAILKEGEKPEGDGVFSSVDGYIKYLGQSGKGFWDIYYETQGIPAPRPAVKPLET